MCALASVLGSILRQFSDARERWEKYAPAHCVVKLIQLHEEQAETSVFFILNSQAHLRNDNTLSVCFSTPVASFARVFLDTLTVCPRGEQRSASPFFLFWILPDQRVSTFANIFDGGGRGHFFPHAWLMTAEKRNTRSFLAVKMRPVGSREERFSRSSVVGLDTWASQFYCVSSLADRLVFNIRFFEWLQRGAFASSDARILSCPTRRAPFP